MSSSTKNKRLAIKKYITILSLYTNLKEVVMTIDQKEINRNFKYHAPKADQPAMYEQIKNSGKQFALVINQLCLDSREKSIAITKLEEAVMWANASIARN